MYLRISLLCLFEISLSPLRKASVPSKAIRFARNAKRTGGTQATVVDYIIPLRGNQKLFWDRKNWRALCKPYYDRKIGHEVRILYIDSKNSLPYDRER